MPTFRDEAGQAWVATANEEDTPRHHGRWFLVFHPEGRPDDLLAVPEVRWQTLATGERTLRTMSVFELRRRLRIVRSRAGRSTSVSAAGAQSGRTSAVAG